MGWIVWARKAHLTVREVELSVSVWSRWRPDGLPPPAAGSAATRFGEIFRSLPMASVRFVRKAVRLPPKRVKSAAAALGGRVTSAGVKWQESDRDQERAKRSRASHQYVFPPIGTSGRATSVAVMR